MLIYKKEDVPEEDYDFTVSGANKEYTFYSIKKGIAIENIKGENVICILASIANNPLGFSYNRIGYYENLSEFLKSKDFKSTHFHYIFLKEVLDKDKASEIISDIADENVIF